MEIKRIILEQLVNEARIAQISANITLSLDVQSTGHSSKQRFRHKDTNSMIISNSDIRDVIEKAKGDIALNIVHGEIESGRDFVISDKTGNKGISLAIVPQENSPYHWILVVRTVFSSTASGEPFRVGRNQLHLQV
jgi:hypothetical protein